MYICYDSPNKMATVNSIRGNKHMPKSSHVSSSYSLAKAWSPSEVLVNWRTVLEV